MHKASFNGAIAKEYVGDHILPHPVPPQTVKSSDALLNARGIPRIIEVNQLIGELKVAALATGFVRNEQPRTRLRLILPDVLLLLLLLHVVAELSYSVFTKLRA